MNHTFEELYAQRHQIGRRIREEGKQVFGYLSNYVPEEILHAGGIIPVRLRSSGTGLKKVGKYLPPNICSYLRGCLDEGLLDSYDYLDGVIAVKSCDAVRNFFSIWVRLIKPSFSFFIAFPSKNTAQAKDYLMKELKEFRTSLEDYLGKKINNEDIWRSIDIYNQNRAHLTRLRQMRLERKIDLAGSEFHAIVMASYIMPKEEHNGLLEDFKPASTSQDRIQESVPLAILGNTIEDIDLLRIIEKYGGHIILDNLSLGSPYYLNEVKKDTDPLSMIAERYLTKPVEPYRSPSQGRIEGLIQDTKTYKISGVVNFVQQYCDEYLFENVPLAEELKKNGIPYLFLDMDDTVLTLKQMETRIQAFMEMLKDLPGKPSDE